MDPTVQGIIDKLPGALQDLQAADAELAAKSGEVDGATQRQAELESDHESATTDITLEHSRRIFEGYSPKLRDIIRHAFADDNELMRVPPLEDCQRIAELDGIIAAAAGQPVVVMKPGKDWIDVGMLDKSRETDRGERTGLQLSYSFKAGGSSIVLPVHDAMAIDVSTGAEPSWEDKREDEELRHRDHLRIGSQPERSQPYIDPLHTRVLPAAEDTEPPKGEGGTTHVLVGYGYLQHTLNRIYGFDFSELKGGEEMEDYKKFRAVIKLQERLEQVGIDFDIDYIDGCLAYRIDKLEASIEAGGSLQGLSSPYQQSVLDGMKQKLAGLVEDGWISG